MNRQLQLRQDLERIVRAGVDAVDAGRLVRAALDRLDPAALPTAVVAAGKAASGMFDAACRVVDARAAVVAAPASVHHRPPAPHVLHFAAGHPSPNADSVAAGERALALAATAGRERGLLVLLSGGASAMLAAPAEGITLGDKLETARALMHAGAAIHELNCVRKHLSRVKGGRLAAAARRTVTFALSDVHGPVADDPSVIGSGPTVPDETTFAEALAVIAARGAQVPGSVRRYLERGARGDVPETIKPGDPRLADSTYIVIGNRQTASDGARHEAERLGYRVVVIPEATAGEARDAAPAFVSQGLRAAQGTSGPLCVVATGETTVTVHGSGTGGRNQEFALSAAAPLAGCGRPVILASAGTDGIDGPTDAAGAIADSTTLERALHRGLNAQAALAANDAYHFFAPLGDLLQWGPTGTNVGDLHVLLIA